MMLIEKKIQKVLNSNFQSFQNAWECTQFIRGELFYYIDALLTTPNSVHTDDLPSLINFIELAFKLILKWFEIMPSHLSSFKEALQTPNLFNVDLSAAIAMCGYELSFILGSIWGMNKRTKSFFAKFCQNYLCVGKYCLQSKI